MRRAVLINFSQSLSNKQTNMLMVPAEDLLSIVIQHDNRTELKNCSPIDNVSSLYDLYRNLKLIFKVSLTVIINFISIKSVMNN